MMAEIRVDRSCRIRMLQLITHTLDADEIGAAVL